MLAGLCQEGCLHCHPGSSAQHHGRLLEDGLGEDGQRRGHAGREREGEKMGRGIVWYIALFIPVLIHYTACHTTQLYVYETHIQNHTGLGGQVEPHTLGQTPH